MSTFLFDDGRSAELDDHATPKRRFVACAKTAPATPAAHPAGTREDRASEVLRLIVALHDRGYTLRVVETLGRPDLVAIAQRDGVGAVVGELFAEARKIVGEGT